MRSTLQFGRRVFESNPHLEYHMRGLEHISYRDVERVRDLGLMIDGGTTPKIHTVETTRKAKSTIDSVIRNSRYFESILQTLGVSVSYSLEPVWNRVSCKVRAIMSSSYLRTSLEFGSLIWNPYSVALSQNVEGVLKRHVKFQRGHSSITLQN